MSPRLGFLALVAPVLVHCGGAPPAPPEPPTAATTTVPTAAAPVVPTRAESPARLPQSAVLRASLDLHGVSLDALPVGVLLEEAGLAELLRDDAVDMARPFGFAIVGLSERERARVDAVVAQAKRTPDEAAFAMARDVAKSLPALGTFRVLVPVRDRAALTRHVEQRLETDGLTRRGPGILARANVAFRLGGDDKTLAIDLAMGEAVRPDVAFANVDRALAAGTVDAPDTAGSRLHAVYAPKELAYVSFMRGIAMIDAALSGAAVAPDQKAMITAAGLGEALQSFAIARSREVDVRIGDAPLGITVRARPEDASVLGLAEGAPSLEVPGATTTFAMTHALTPLGEPKGIASTLMAIREAGAMGYPIALPEMVVAGALTAPPAAVTTARADARVVRAGMLTDEKTHAEIAFALLREGVTAKEAGELAKTLATAAAAPKNAKPAPAPASKGAKPSKTAPTAEVTFANARVITAGGRLAIVGGNDAAHLPRTATLVQAPAFVFRGEPTMLGGAFIVRMPTGFFRELSLTIGRDGDALQLAVTAN